MNCASDPPLLKNVAEVPSGPTKLNGPAALLLAAAWNFSVVLAGVDAVQEMVVQFGVVPGAGFESFVDETRVPDGENPVCM